MRIDLLAAGATVSFVIAALPALSATGAAPAVAVPDHTRTLVGTWACTTAQNSSVSMTFVHHPDGTITMRASVQAAADVGTMITGDTFHFDPAAATWTLDSAATSSFGSYHGAAPPWTGKVWTFTGDEPLMGGDGKWHDWAVREVFTALGPTSFRREFQTQTRYNNWRDMSEEVCTQVHP
jgi:hypothetical protein